MMPYHKRHAFDTYLVGKKAFAVIVHTLKREKKSQCPRASGKNHAVNPSEFQNPPKNKERMSLRRWLRPQSKFTVSWTLTHRAQISLPTPLILLSKNNNNKKKNKPSTTNQEAPQTQRHTRSQIPAGFSEYYITRASATCWGRSPKPCPYGFSRLVFFLRNLKGYWKKKTGDEIRDRDLRGLRDSCCLYIGEIREDEVEERGTDKEKKGDIRLVTTHQVRSKTLAYFQVFHPHQQYSLSCT